MNAYKQWAPGTIVRDRYGAHYEVACQSGCRVWMVGRPGWWHPNNIRDA